MRPAEGPRGAGDEARRRGAQLAEAADRADSAGAGEDQRHRQRLQPCREREGEQRQREHAQAGRQREQRAQRDRPSVGRRAAIQDQRSGAVGADDRAPQPQVLLDGEPGGGDHARRCRV
jgi:hypothetical protein